MKSPNLVYLHIQCFSDVFIDCFVLNSNPMSASLENLGIFVYSRSKVKYYFFNNNEARNKCNTLFSCDWD